MKINYREKYVVSDDERTTVCILTVKNAYLMNFFINALNVIRNNAEKGGLPSKKFFVPTQIKGTVRCYETDTYDVKIGKKMAREKAYAKANAFSEKFEDYMRNTLYELSERFTVNK